MISAPTFIQVHFLLIKTICFKITLIRNKIIKGVAQLRPQTIYTRICGTRLTLKEYKAAVRNGGLDWVCGLYLAQENEQLIFI